MTVRFLQSWNGYQPDAVVSGLTNEATLIAAGIATSDTDGANDGRIHDAKFTTDASGNVTGLVGPDIECELISFPHWPIQVPAAANATTSAPGSLQGGVGDVLGKVDCLVNTPGATATLSVQDGTTGAVYTLSPSGGLAVAGFYSYDLGYTALVGPWRIICGAGLSAVANLL